MELFLQLPRLNRICNIYRHENCWPHGTKDIKFRSQRDMAYLGLKIVDNTCINYQKRTLLTPFFIVSLLIEAKLFPQCPKFASNIFRFGEEPDMLTKMLPNPTIQFSWLQLE